MTYYQPFFTSAGELKQTRNIDCARWGNLVYARTLKCGSEFFYRNFTQTAGWQPQRWSDIDWAQDHVFSYVMDPIKRRHKGISEFIVATGSRELLMENGAFRSTIAQVPTLDDHSAALYNIYGEYTDRIEWLPMSDDHGLAVRATDQLLQRYNHPEIPWNAEFTHTTANYMDSIYNCVKELWDETFVNDSVRFYFAQDIELYQRTLKKYTDQ